MSALVEETPEAVLTRLRSVHADPRRRKSLDVIEAVCRAQQEHGSRDYSLKTIGRLSAARKGPSRASIANPSGAAYRELIAAHERAGAPREPAIAGEGDTDAELLAGVTSPLQRARINGALADARHWAEEAKRWRRKANALQAVANASATLTLKHGDGATDMPMAEIGRTTSLDLLPMEKTALSVAFDARRLATNGLRVDSRGRVLDSADRVIFPIGFATMLAKVAAAVGVEFGDGSSVTSPTQAPDPRG